MDTNIKNNSLKILVVSDEVVDKFYSRYIRDLLPDIELIISCGDLPYYYLEYMIDTLNVPMFFVHGNHDSEEEIGEHGVRRYPGGALNLDQKFVTHKGLIFFGLEGSIRYSKSKHQYTQTEMWFKVFRAVPRLLFNRLWYGRALDIFVTHSPAWQVGDAEDNAHRGFKAFTWLLRVFKPKYHLHGHIHLYHGSWRKSAQFADTKVINACSYQKLEFEIPEDKNG